MKKILLGSMAALGLMLALPISNLFAPVTTKQPVVLGQSANPYAKASAEIFTQKCLNCHTGQTNFPLYYSLPVASSLIRADVKAAIENYDLTPVLFAKGVHIPESYFSKLEYVIRQGSMPPLKYTAMHWNAGLSSEDKKTLLSWIEYEREQNAKGTGDVLWNEPVHSLQLNTSLNPDKVRLGMQLFHDKRLSGNNTVSCASCHGLDRGGTDRAQYSTGIFGQKGGINAPTVYNAANNFVQFWDGRAPNLAGQAAGPVANPIEMGGDWNVAPRKLQADPAYVAAFHKLYPDGITANNITDAIAAFEGTLITTNSRFDQYLQGKQDALSADEKKGYALFKSIGCATCHMGVNLGGQTYEKFGRFGDYFTDRGHATDADKGHFSVTRLASDMHKFKVPTLRNIDKTAPYFHDGSTNDLHQAVQTMAKYQLNKKLNDADTDLIVKFLGTLTGEYNHQPLQ